jgi:hypothetical protein
VGPCISQEHTRSIFNVPFNGNLGLDDDEKHKSESWAQLIVHKPNAVIAFICIAAVMVFVSVFAVLQITSRNQNIRSRVSYRDYKKVSTGPSARYDSSCERVSLTENDEEEDSLFEKT